ncbi:hydroxymethylglutaryl-CoA lyase [Pseudomonas sp. S 311-6]|uniref:hydroxymethylglutaryl-CoA lyase n=1 Tax=Pseudomonas TaxID=286 RepID=UPI001CE3E3ED|nr:MULTISPECIES: hydroxymethylglutaryl-CoA lyase [Pseudomonas]MCO7640596.1 hydroxymethylglutaryl-CoA lyase [Pseudomonas sp. S 311-6]MCO7566079.1 hydroxymethylglutaryl-CoA lyase [Pseudomonas mosselii]MCO7596182.1 hydroxymethylglutaryl-CoA lyase [Pseudomonas guariconensis]MCO7617246.1 hydroxymethylglutaryl-CoA lyase [Pseudomonas guariconensis]MCO7634231.1 hydroxymethylglutaryl-CoA lyase [Pseudomonas guariconensis]
MNHITLNEVGMRDGLQSLRSIMPTAAKLKWIDMAYEAGVRHMEVASFVPAKRLPQMADADAVVAHALAFADLTVTVLAPNLHGAQAALASGAQRIIVPVSVSAAHSLSNVRRSPEQMVEAFARMCELRDQAGHPVTMIAGMSTAFGCTLQGQVPLHDLLALTAKVVQAGCDIVSLADTTGHATPGQVERTLQAVRAVAGDKLRSVHFHDTRGQALANSLVAVQHGIRELDASLGGIGGCPFAPGVSGNAVSEDLVFMLEGMGFRTGIDIERLLACRKAVETSLPGEQLHGHLARAGLPRRVPTFA